MKPQQSLKKKSNSRAANEQPLRLALSVHVAKAVELPVSVSRLRRVARRALQAARQHGRFTIALACVDNRAMRRLNRRYAQHDDATDVLSFPAREHIGDFHAPSVGAARVEFLGDIVISLPQAKRQAKDAGHSLAHELAILLTHGVLHLLGYDHYTQPERKVMQALEAQALAKE